jgi:hypothetical protein
MYLAEALLWLGMISCRDGGENGENGETIVPGEFLHIEIGALPDKTVYRLGETPDFTGLAVNDVYTDGSRKETAEYEILWENSFKRGTDVVTVTSREWTAAFEVFFEDELMDTGLPVVYIETERQQPVLSKKDYVNALMIIKENGETLHENGLRIRGRGNATWDDCPKKPYKLKLDGKTDLLGMGEDKDWTLLAGYRDKSLMRTSIAFRLSELLGFPWTPKARFVELVLNGEYMGNYQLTEIVKRGAHRVDIPKDGYLIERDDYYLEEPVWFETPRGYGYSFKNPDTDDLTEAQLNYIRDYMTALETVLASDAFNDPVSGYAKYIDTGSFARWFLFQQIMANIDSNVYLTKKDNGDSKLFMEPVWDFEWSLGVGWYYGERPRPANYYVYESRAFYYNRLLRDPAFTAELKRQWQQINVRQDILQHIDETKEMLQRSQALNFRRWDILNTLVSYGGIPLGSYEKEVACDREFFVNHINWLHAAIHELN